MNDTGIAEIIGSKEKLVNSKAPKDWSFSWEHPGICAYYYKDGNIVVRATPGWEVNENNIPIEITVNDDVVSDDEEIKNFYSVTSDNDEKAIAKYIKIMSKFLPKIAKRYTKMLEDNNKTFDNLINRLEKSTNIQEKTKTTKSNPVVVVWEKPVSKNYDSEGIMGAMNLDVAAKIDKFEITDTLIKALYKAGPGKRIKVKGKRKDLWLELSDNHDNVLESFDPYKGKVSKEFEDSTDATDFMELIDKMLRDPRLMEWAKETDYNFSVKTMPHLKKAMKAYADFMDQIYSAE